MDDTTKPTNTTSDAYTGESDDMMLDEENSVLQELDNL